ncbi:hypothetical protein Gogos_015096, partial [Gossypium gossypioides]|nr:hypothetical protein [Gossypium gossypioides]
VELARKGIGHDSACGVCGQDSKDVLYATRDCFVARNVWDHLIPTEWCSRFYARNLQEWLVLNLQNQHNWHLGDADWQCLFGIIAWRLWKNRNLFIFQGTLWTNSEIIKVANSWAKQYFSSKGSKANDSQGKFPPLFLNNDYVLLSIDGSVLEKAGFAAVGGIVHDRGGAWIFGFNKYLWNCSIFEAELWGILEGLSLLVELGYDSVLIHFDCLEAFTTILEGSFEGSNSVLVRRIYQILLWFKYWDIRQISRGENQEANHLSKMA